MGRARAGLALSLGLLRGGGLGLQRVLDLFDQCVKGSLVANRQIAQYLAVELDVGGFEALDEAAVADAGVAASGVQTNDPETAEIALLLPASGIRVLPRVLNGFLRVAKELGLIAEVAFGVLQDFLATLTRRGGVSCTSHVGFSFVLIARGSALEFHPGARLRFARWLWCESVADATGRR